MAAVRRSSDFRHLGQSQKNLYEYSRGDKGQIYESKSQWQIDGLGLWMPSISSFVSCPTARATAVQSVYMSGVITSYSTDDQKIPKVPTRRFGVLHILLQLKNCHFTTFIHYQISNLNFCLGHDFSHVWIFAPKMTRIVLVLLF